jgi:DNA-binding NarL/FixJ family response regulator
VLNILIVDDQLIMRRHLRGLIETQPGWSVCGEAINGRQAIGKIQATEPDLVILDLHMPAMDGFETTRELLVALPELKILILSADELSEFGAAATQCGAKGFVVKSRARTDLVGATKAVLRGETFF